MSIASQLMAYPSWTARRRTVDQPQPVEPPNWPICFPQRRVPDEQVRFAGGPVGYGNYGPGADTSANPFEQIIDIID